MEIIDNEKSDVRVLINKNIKDPVEEFMSVAKEYKMDLNPLQ
jgi:hypothetical protein|tara:strand:+ start:666 stop:791 length:126 start_codon:yes stop_codon:yes gene_type:complete